MLFLISMCSFLMYHRTNVLSCKERSPQKKKYSNSKVREENIAVVFIQLWSLQLEKFILVASFFSLPLGGDGVWVRAGCLTHACHGRLGRTDRDLGTCFDSCLQLSKISLLVFLYRDFGEQIEDPRMFDVTSETRDNTSVIILKSRLALQVILPACASLVTPSLIDDSAPPLYYINCLCSKSKKKNIYIIILLTIWFLALDNTI